VGRVPCRGEEWGQAGGVRGVVVGGRGDAVVLWVGLQGVPGWQVGRVRAAQRPACWWQCVVGAGVSSPQKQPC